MMNENDFYDFFTNEYLKNKLTKYNKKLIIEDDFIKNIITDYGMNFYNNITQTIIINNNKIIEEDIFNKDINKDYYMFIKFFCPTNDIKQYILLLKNIIFRKEFLKIKIIDDMIKIKLFISTRDYEYNKNINEFLKIKNINLKIILMKNVLYILPFKVSIAYIIFHDSQKDKDKIMDYDTNVSYGVMFLYDNDILRDMHYHDSKKINGNNEYYYDIKNFL